MDLIAKLPGMEDAALALAAQQCRASRAVWVPKAQKSAAAALLPALETELANRRAAKLAASTAKRAASTAKRAASRAATKRTGWSLGVLALRPAPAVVSSHLEPREARHDGVATIQRHHHRVLRHPRGPCGGHSRGGGRGMSRAGEVNREQTTRLGSAFREPSRRFAGRERPQDF